MQGVESFLLVICLITAVADSYPHSGVKGRPFKGRKMGNTRFRSSPTIVGGKTAVVTEFPYMAYIRVFFEGDPFPEFCGGIIIGPRHILSAAHCLKKTNIARVCAVLGSENRRHSKSHKFTVMQSTSYPKRKWDRMDADIAVLMVDRQIPLWKRNIQSIRLRTPQDFLPANSNCSVAGWGKTYNPTVDPNILRYVKVPLVQRNRCLAAYPNLTAIDTLCAGDYERGGKDACKGDSGGPLVCEELLTGVVKEGKGCGRPRLPGIYTDVRFYAAWVQHVVDRDMAEAPPYGVGRNPQCY